MSYCFFFFIKTVGAALTEERSIHSFTLPPPRPTAPRPVAVGLFASISPAPPSSSPPKLKTPRSGLAAAVSRPLAQGREICPATSRAPSRPPRISAIILFIHSKPKFLVPLPSASFSPPHGRQSSFPIPALPRSRLPGPVSPSARQPRFAVIQGQSF